MKDSCKRRTGVLMGIDKDGAAPTLSRVVCGFADIKELVAKGRYHVQLPEVRSGHGGLSTINNDYKSYYHTHKYYAHQVYEDYLRYQQRFQRYQEH